MSPGVKLNFAGFPPIIWIKFKGPHNKLQNSKVESKAELLVNGMVIYLTLR